MRKCGRGEGTVESVEHELWFEIRSSFATVSTTGGNSIFTYVFVISSTEKALVRVPLLLADTVVTSRRRISELMSYRTTYTIFTIRTGRTVMYEVCSKSIRLYFFPR
jgi:hypothetical protein